MFFKRKINSVSTHIHHASVERATLIEYMYSPSRSSQDYQVINMDYAERTC